MAKQESLVPVERIEKAILLIRGQKVMLDADLANLYGVSTKRLNEQVRRNRDRFPDDFMFQLTVGEKSEVVANCDHLSKLKFSSALPHAFTEHGAIMAVSVLNTQRAVEASIFVVRAFVRLREMLATHRQLSRKLRELERKIESHDEGIQAIFEAIHQLMASPEKPKKKTGFEAKENKLSIAKKQRGQESNDPMDVPFFSVGNKTLTWYLHAGQLVVGIITILIGYAIRAGRTLLGPVLIVGVRVAKLEGAIDHVRNRKDGRRSNVICRPNRSYLLIYGRP